MGHLITVATCALNQWAMDFDGNYQRILESIRRAKAAGASLRVGPELEIPGYGCLDSFLEGDTDLHSWEVLALILKHPDAQGILLDVGMPVVHRNVRYNCRMILYSGQILLIRPKLYLCNDRNYREMRYFTGWQRPRHVEEYYLPRLIQDIVGKVKVPIGDAVISTRDTCIGAETCEELFVPDSPHIGMSLNGVEIITNSSGSHHELRKLDTRIDLILEATKKSSGIYLYSNQRGCDGDRLYYDGCAMIIINGKVVAQGAQFGLEDVEVLTATLDIEEVRSARWQQSRAQQAVQAPAYQRIELDASLSPEGSVLNPSIGPTPNIPIRYHLPEEEIALGPACWLWDYLRRSGTAGYFLPLSGGIDSCATAVIVYSMCRLVYKAAHDGNQQVIQDVRRVCPGKEKDWLPSSPQEICNSIMHTCYMGTEKASSKETRSRAKELAEAIGSYHVDQNIDIVVEAFTTLISNTTDWKIRFKSQGGTNQENLTLQNIQARSRMVNAYMLAQMLPTVRNRAGSLLVLGSANVDECLRGYLTKYDCSSADINPIGGISKTDLKRFIKWGVKELNLPILEDFYTAIPTAELEPIVAEDKEKGTKAYVQSDEVDMGMTYDELSQYGTLRKNYKLGLYSMWEHLSRVWGRERGLGPREVYEKVRTFFWFFNINRHKMTVMTPAYHAEQYSPDDNRHDLRQFLFPKFLWQQRKVESELARLEASNNNVAERKAELRKDEVIGRSKETTEESDDR